MDAWKSIDLVCEGSLQYREKKKLSLRCRWFTAKLFLETDERPKRLELWDGESHSPVLSIPLKEVLEVSATETKELKYAFQIVTARKSHLFGTKCEEQRTMWIKFTSDVTNGVPLPKVVYSFKVEMLSNMHSNSLHLHGTYTFKIADTHTALFSNSGLLPTQFLIDLVHIKRIRFTFFNQNSKDLCICAIYTHSYSPVKEGTYVFQTKSGNDLSKIVSTRVTMRYISTGTPIPANLLDDKACVSSTVQGSNTLPLSSRRRSSSEGPSYFQPTGSVESLLTFSVPGSRAVPCEDATLSRKSLDWPHSFLKEEHMLQNVNEKCDYFVHRRTSSSNVTDSANTTTALQDWCPDLDSRRNVWSSSVSPQQLLDNMDDTDSEEDTDEQGYIRVTPTYQRDPCLAKHDPTHHSQKNTSEVPTISDSLLQLDTHPQNAANSHCQSDQNELYFSDHSYDPTGKGDSIAIKKHPIHHVAAEPVAMATGFKNKGQRSPAADFNPLTSSSSECDYHHHHHQQDQLTEDISVKKDNVENEYIKILPSQRELRLDYTHHSQKDNRILGVPIPPSSEAAQNRQTLTYYSNSYRTGEQDSYATRQYPIYQTAVKSTAMTTVSKYPGCLSTEFNPQQNTSSSNSLLSDQQQPLDNTEVTDSDEDTDENGYTRVLPSQGTSFNLTHSWLTKNDRMHQLMSASCDHIDHWSCTPLDHFCSNDTAMPTRMETAPLKLSYSVNDVRDVSTAHMNHYESIGQQCVDQLHVENTSEDLTNSTGEDIYATVKDALGSLASDKDGRDFHNAHSHGDLSESGDASENNGLSDVQSLRTSSISLRPPAPLPHIVLHSSMSIQPKNQYEKRTKPMVTSRSLNYLSQLSLTNMDSNEENEGDYVYANREALDEMFWKTKYLSSSSRNIYGDPKQENCARKSTSTGSSKHNTLPGDGNFRKIV